MYEVFEHTADLGLRVRAASLDELFADAGRGLFSLIVDNIDAIEPRETVEIELNGGDREYLVFDWLNELLYLFESRRLLLSQFELTVSATGLRATARGEALDRARHQLEHEVKAITYHGLRVEHLGDVWLAEVIVDI